MNAGASKSRKTAQGAPFQRPDPIVPQASAAMADFFVKAIAALHHNAKTMLGGNTASPFSGLTEEFTRAMLEQLARRVGTTAPAASEPPPEAPASDRPEARRRKRRRTRRPR